MLKDLLSYINIKNPLFRFFLWISFFGFIALADLLISTKSSTEQTAYIWKFVITFLTSGAVFYIIRYGFGMKAANPLNFLISTWIVFLLIHPTNNLWIFYIAVIAIALSKFLFKRNRQPIFNPAAFAIVITYLITKLISLVNPSAQSLLVSWWGADMFQNSTQNIPILNVIIPVTFLFTFIYTTTLFKKNSLCSFLLWDISCCFFSVSYADQLNGKSRSFCFSFIV